jgi:hypothetical protein
MAGSGKQFGLAYLKAAEIDKYLEAHRGHVLSVIGFGHELSLPGHAPLWVDIPVLGGYDSSVEVWTSDLPV